MISHNNEMILQQKDERCMMNYEIVLWYMMNDE
jgi:hypothetical protein